MPTTQAQIDANRKNSSKSCGPKTVEGKSVSRRNSLKHGLSGDGVVFLDEQTAEVTRRTAVLLKQLKPGYEMSQYLVERVAVLSIRVEHCAEHETLLMAVKGHEAGQAFDDNRLLVIEELFQTLAETPSLTLGKLSRTPDGVERLLEAWTKLRHDLDRGAWQTAHAHRAAHLQGLDPDDCLALEWSDFTQTIRGKHNPAQFGQNLQLDPIVHAEWARGEIRKLIQGEVDALSTALEAFDDADDDALARERRLVVKLARFAPTPETLLVRKYEAAAERNLYRALREARLIDSAPTLLEQAGYDAPDDDVATHEAESTSAPLASFVPGPPQTPPEDNTPLNDTERAEMNRFLSAMGMPLSIPHTHNGKTGETLTTARRRE